MLSEYAVGAHCWVMTLTFAAWAAGSAFLLVALASQERSVMGRIGLVFRLATAVGLAMAAKFNMDPITTPPEAASFSGKMHGVSAMIGIPGEIIAVLLLSLALRKQAAWASAPLVSLTALIWLSLIVMSAGIMMAMRQRQPMTGPGIIGWANRVLMVVYCVWMLVVAWPMARATR